tara:strand:- start:899 stop:1159 length:261 start_codon:yes stop_codon:yes gene_type:complete
MKYKIEKNQEVVVMNESNELAFETLKSQRLFDESDIVKVDKYYSSDDKNVFRNQDMIVFKDKVKDFVMCLFEDLTLINNNQMKVSI